MQVTLIMGAILLALLGTSIGVNKMQYDHVEELNQVIANERAKVQTLNDAVKTQQDTIYALETRRAEDQRDIIALGDNLAYAQLEKEEAVAQFNAYRKRLDTAAIARPTLVGRVATRATKRVFDAFFEASGGGNSSERDTGISPASPDTDLSSASNDNGSDTGTDEVVE